MKIKLLLFGQILDIVNQSELEIEGVGNTKDLIQKLGIIYPKLPLVKFAIAINKEIVKENSPLKDGDTVAILPPFSGG